MSLWSSLSNSELHLSCHCSNSHWSETKEKSRAPDLARDCWFHFIQSLMLSLPPSALFFLLQFFTSSPSFPYEFEPVFNYSELDFCTSWKKRYIGFCLCLYAKMEEQQWEEGRYRIFLKHKLQPFSHWQCVVFPSLLLLTIFGTVRCHDNPIKTVSQ